MKLRDLDLGWLTVIAVGTFSHVNNACIVGFCGDPAIASFQADLPFILFNLSVLTFVADHNWYPTTLKKPHNFILLLLNIIIALTVSNLTLRFIWLPLRGFIFSSSVWIFKWVYVSELQQSSHATDGSSAWKVYFSNILEQHSAHAVPTPMLRLAEETEDNSALLQWSDESLPFSFSLALSLLLLGSRFFAASLWDRIRLLCLSAQGALRRRRGRILLLPGGSLARLRSLAPRYVLSKVDESEDDVPSGTPSIPQGPPPPHPHTRGPVNIIPHSLTAFGPPPVLPPL